MTLTTRFSPGDLVWFMRDNRPHYGLVWIVRVVVKGESRNEYPETQYPGDLMESECLGTRAELIESL